MAALSPISSFFALALLLCAFETGATASALFHPPPPPPPPAKTRVAVIGAGVIGTSTTLAMMEAGLPVEVTMFSDLPFEQTTSYGPAGLFRIDNGTYRSWGSASFQRFSDLFRDVGGSSGVQKLSGYILSDNIEKLKMQEENYSDIVYDFHWLNQREMQQFNPNRTNLHGIHFTTFTTEGRTYVPWMQQRLQKFGVRVVRRRIANVRELLRLGFDVVVNCAGIRGPEVAQDDVLGTFPIRGVLFQVHAPWQKHFLYENFDTFTIPTIDGVYLGTVKQDNDSRPQITNEDRRDVQRRYIRLQPAFKGVPVVSEWIGFRPGRESVRLEAVPYGRQLVVHNYGHGGNGFTLSWGCAEAVTNIIRTHLNSCS